MIFSNSTATLSPGTTIVGSVVTVNLRSFIQAYITPVYITPQPMIEPTFVRKPPNLWYRKFDKRR